MSHETVCWQCGSPECECLPSSDLDESFLQHGFPPSLPVPPYSPSYAPSSSSHAAVRPPVSYAGGGGGGIDPRYIPTALALPRGSNIPPYLYNEHYAGTLSDIDNFAHITGYNVPSQPPPIEASPIPPPAVGAVPPSSSKESEKRPYKRAAAGTAQRPKSRRKRRRTDPADPQVPNTAVPGVGPLATPLAGADDPGLPTPIGTASGEPGRVHESLTRPSTTKSRSRSKQAATDVWFFLRGLTSGVQPDPWPSDFTQEQDSVKRPSPKTYTHLGCKLCSRLPQPKWKTWSNTDGMTVAIRKHLSSVHSEDWLDLVEQHELKDHDSIHLSRRTDEDEARRILGPFTVEKMEELLVRWITADDQSLNVIENPDFRAFILFCVGDKMNASQLLGRTRLKKLIAQRFQERHRRLVALLKRSLGRVSFTSDVWSNGVLSGFMAVTAHFCIRDPATHKIELHSELVAFRYIPGSHTGEVLGEHFDQILTELGVTDKTGLITLDNASNCDTMLEHVAVLMHRRMISFDAVKNRGRCFAHVVNISQDHGISALPNVNPDEIVASLGRPLTAAEEGYLDALRSDVVRAARELVTACRGSALRRQGIQDAISEANDKFIWGQDEDGHDVIVDPQRQLLRDMDIRWSSRYLMMDRVLELHPAIKIFLDKPEQAAIAHHELTDIQIQVLEDVCMYLDIPHATQELLSAELTPTVCLVLPGYEKLVRLLKLAGKRYYLLAHAIEASISKLVEYLEKSRSNKIYALAMMLNPTIKREWLTENWTSEECKQADEHIRAAMMEYRKAQHLVESRQRSALRPPSSAARTAPLSRGSRLSASSTSVAQRRTAHANASRRSGVQRLMDLERSLSAGDLDAAAGIHSAPTAVVTPGPEISSSADSVSSEEEERVANERDKVCVDAELLTYLSAGLSHDSKEFDIFQYWTDNQHRYPLLFNIAMDVLPMQATSVPCERIFSSAKETDTKRRNRLSPEMMEALQILKQSYLRERLNFTAHWLAKDSELVEATEGNSSSMHSLLSNSESDSSGGLVTLIDAHINSSDISEA